MIGQIEIRTSEYLMDKVQYRFPRSKRKRIRKKWAKQEKNYHWVPSRSILRMGNLWFCHPTLLPELRRAIQ